MDADLREQPREAALAGCDAASYRTNTSERGYPWPRACTSNTTARGVFATVRRDHFPCDRFTGEWRRRTGRRGDVMAEPETRLGAILRIVESPNLPMEPTTVSSWALCSPLSALHHRTTPEPCQGEATPRDIEASGGGRSGARFLDSAPLLRLLTVLSDLRPGK